MKSSAKRNMLSAAISGLLALGLTTLATPVLASQANPNSFVERQPDGSSIRLRLRGDENFSWLEDASGYTVIQNGKWYEYAKLDASGKLAPNGLIVGRDDPKVRGLQPHVLPSPEIRAESNLKIDGKAVRYGTPGKSAAPLGTVKNLVVLLRFADHAARAVPTSANISTLFNAVGGDPVLAPSGSIRDVYYENSYGQMTLDSTTTAWVTLSQTEAYYANGNRGLTSKTWEALTEALNAIDATINFDDYDSDHDGVIDSIAFIHSGYGAEWGGTSADGANYLNRIWSHRWAMNQPGGWMSADGVKVYDYHISPGIWGTSGTAIGRIGVIAHETGHFFGLPDLYDTNGGGQGAGSWELMANSWDFLGTQYCPPHFSPWSKTALGWYTPTVISTPGVYTINQAETNAEAYKITQGFPTGEYLLIENRQDTGFDCSIPQGGLIVWHIDDTAGYSTEGYPGQVGWPTNGKHYRVAVLQADGGYDLEKGLDRGDAGDAYHGGGVDAIVPGPGGHPNTDTYQGGVVNSTNIAITDISASAPEMSFTLGFIDPPPMLSIGNASVTEGNGGTKQMTFTASLTEPSATGVSFNFSTADGSATAANGDYEPRSMVSKTIPAGQTSVSFNITINGDTAVEPNESFMVNLTDVVGVAVSDAQGVGTIVTDDFATLQNGVPITGLASPQGTNLFYKMIVPAGKTGLSIRTSGGTGDADLHVKFNSMVSLSSFDCRPYADGNNEVCNFPTAPPGTYWIMLNAYTAFSGVTLTGSYSPINLSVSDVFVTEGDSGTTAATFNVNLSGPSASAVTFDSATSDGTATAGSDYVARALTAGTIPAGMTTVPVTVNVNGDTATEANETFFLNVSHVVGATNVDPKGKATINTDDYPNLTVSDVTIVEGGSGTKVANFTVNLSRTSTSSVGFDFATADGTATAGSDYVGRELTHRTIAAGATSSTVGVVINGDFNGEEDETFFLNISGVTGAHVADGQGGGIIKNDDLILPPGN